MAARLPTGPVGLTPASQLPANPLTPPGPSARRAGRRFLSDLRGGRAFLAAELEQVRLARLRRVPLGRPRARPVGASHDRRPDAIDHRHSDWQGRVRQLRRPRCRARWLRIVPRRQPHQGPGRPLCGRGHGSVDIRRRDHRGQPAMVAGRGGVCVGLRHRHSRRSWPDGPGGHAPVAGRAPDRQCPAARSWPRGRAGSPGPRRRPVAGAAGDHVLGREPGQRGAHRARHHVRRPGRVCRRRHRRPTDAAKSAAAHGELCPARPQPAHADGGARVHARPGRGSRADPGHADGAVRPPARCFARARPQPRPRYGGTRADRARGSHRRSSGPACRAPDRCQECAGWRLSGERHRLALGRRVASQPVAQR